MIWLREPKPVRLLIGQYLGLKNLFRLPAKRSLFLMRKRLPTSPMVIVIKLLPVQTEKNAAGSVGSGCAPLIPAPIIMSRA